MQSPAALVLHKSWGAAMKRRRKVLGFSQSKLANLVEATQPMISDWENGRSAPRDDMKFRIAGALGVPVDYLFSFPAVVPDFPQAAVS